MNNKIKRSFESTIRMPYQDGISLLMKTIDFHNKEAMTDFSNSEFHKNQAMVLKLYLIDLKEFIQKNEQVIGKNND